MNESDLPFLGKTPAEVEKFVGSSYEGRRVVTFTLSDGLDVNTNGVPRRNLRECVRNLASQTLHAVQLLRVMGDKIDGPVNEFLVIELDMKRGPLASVASLVPGTLVGRQHIYTALCTSCIVEQSLEKVRSLADTPRAVKKS